MGSFSEVVLGFSFRLETPDHVLAAFSALAVPSPPDVRGREAPVLPDPLQVQDEDYENNWEPTDELQDPAEDPQPWRHDWAGWLSQSMSVSITPSAHMVWSETGRWTVSCRWGIKSWPEAIIPALRWLGPYLEGFDQRPILLGYIEYTSEPRPTLLWLTPEGTIEGEDLN